MTITFATAVGAPVTFSISDINSNYCNSSTPYECTFLDEVTLTATDVASAGILPTVSGLCSGQTNTTAGNNRIIRADINPRKEEMAGVLVLLQIFRLVQLDSVLKQLQSLTEIINLPIQFGIIILHISTSFYQLSAHRQHLQLHRLHPSLEQQPFVLAHQQH